MCIRDRPAVFGNVYQPWSGLFGFRLVADGGRGAGAVSDRLCGGKDACHGQRLCHRADLFLFCGAAHVSAPGAVLGYSGGDPVAVSYTHLIEATDRVLPPVRAFLLRQ